MAKGKLAASLSGIKLLFREPGVFLRKVCDIFRQTSRIIRPVRADYQSRFDMDLRQWIRYHHKNIVFDQCSWMGVRALKNPLDAWIYQEIIYDVQPDVIVEIGSANGGSTLFFAHLLDCLGKGTVVSIDINRTDYKVSHERIIEVTGDSSSEEVVGKVKDLCSGKSVLVIHDGGHRKEQVLRDLASYSELVSLNSYFIVEDGVVDLFKPGDGVGQWYEGPLKAVEQFISERSDFIVDIERERYILTYNPKGFLKRIR